MAFPILGIIAVWRGRQVYIITILDQDAIAKGEKR